MPSKKYRVRLESPDMMIGKGKPHFRVTQQAAANKDEARRLCEEREAGMVAQRYSDEQVAEMEAIAKKAKDQGLPVPKAVRGQLHTHKQTRPYKVVSVEEVS